MNKLISLTQNQEVAIINIINMASRTIGDGMSFQFGEINGLISSSGFITASIEAVESYLETKKVPTETLVAE